MDFCAARLPAVPAHRVQGQEPGADLTPSRIVASARTRWPARILLLAHLPEVDGAVARAHDRRAPRVRAGGGQEGGHRLRLLRRRAASCTSAGRV